MNENIKELKEIFKNEITNSTYLLILINSFVLLVLSILFLIYIAPLQAQVYLKNIELLFAFINYFTIIFFLYKTATIIVYFSKKVKKNE